MKKPYNRPTTQVFELETIAPMAASGAFIPIGGTGDFSAPSSRDNFEGTSEKSDWDNYEN